MMADAPIWPPYKVKPFLNLARKWRRDIHELSHVDTASWVIDCGDRGVLDVTYVVTTVRTWIHLSIDQNRVTEQQAKMAIIGPTARVIKIGRRICWPGPDAVCLQGGCAYCRDQRFKGINQIQEYLDARPNLIADYDEGMRFSERIIWNERVVDK